MRPLRSFLLATLVAANFLPGAPVQAVRAAEQPPAVTVALRDLDLGTAAGLRTAHARIRRAAEAVCGDYPHATVIVPTDVRRCRTVAARDADNRLAGPVLASR